MTPAYAHEWLCQKMVEGCPVAIVFADCEGIIRLWNAGAETMFGYRAEEALGQTLDIIIPERHRVRHWESYHKVMETGVSRYGHEVLAVPAITKDSKRISIEFNILMLRAPSGEVLGPAAIIRDVTERWEQDKALRARLAELEAKLEQVGKTA